MESEFVRLLFFGGWAFVCSLIAPFIFFKKKEKALKNAPYGMQVFIVFLWFAFAAFFVVFAVKSLQWMVG